MRHGLSMLLVLALTALAPGAEKQADAPAPPVNHLVSGNQLYEKAKYREAMKEYRLAIEKGQQKAFAWFNLGNCHVQLQDYPEAIVAYNRSVEAAPEFSRAWLLMGDVYYTLGSPGRAILSYRRYLEIEEEDFHAYQMMGEAALKGGDVAEALKWFDQALKLDPGAVDIYFAMAEAYSRIQDYQAAIDMMNEAVLGSVNLNASVFFYLGRLHELAGDVKSAIRAYEEGLSYAPNRKEYYFRIASLHEREEADFLALLTLEQALEAGITDSDLHLERGRLFFGQKRWERALEEFSKAYRQGNGSARRGIENVAAAYHNEGELNKSRKALSRLH